MEPLLESDVGNDERCSRQEVALRQNEVQQVRGTLINSIAGDVRYVFGKSSSWRLQEFSPAGTSAVTLMAMRKEPFQEGQEMNKDALVFKGAPLHGGKSPKLKRSPVRGVTKVSVTETVQDWPFSFNSDFFEYPRSLLGCDVTSLVRSMVVTVCCGYWMFRLCSWCLAVTSIRSLSRTTLSCACIPLVSRVCCGNACLLSTGKSVSRCGFVRRSQCRSLPA